MDPFRIRIGNAPGDGQSAIHPGSVNRPAIRFRLKHHQIAGDRDGVGFHFEGRGIAVGGADVKRQISFVFGNGKSDDR